MNSMHSKKKNKRPVFILVALFLIVGISVVLWYYFGYINAMCPYDVNRDDKVGSEDLSAVLLKFGNKCTICREDVNRDKIVNELDIKLIEENYRRQCK